MATNFSVCFTWISRQLLACTLSQRFNFMTIRKISFNLSQFRFKHSHTICLIENQTIAVFSGSDFSHWFRNLISVNWRWTQMFFSKTSVICFKLFSIITQCFFDYCVKFWRKKPSEHKYPLLTVIQNHDFSNILLSNNKKDYSGKKIK